jgi:hypothetical protein
MLEGALICPWTTDKHAITIIADMAINRQISPHNLPSRILCNLCFISIFSHPTCLKTWYDESQEDVVQLSEKNASQFAARHPGRSTATNIP